VRGGSTAHEQKETLSRILERADSSKQQSLDREGFEQALAADLSCGAASASACVSISHIPL
jgi:hypothetical protein